MLVLTRKVGNRIIIDNHIIVTVADVKGDSVRLAIEAPKDVKIYRGEIYDAIVEENRKASLPQGGLDLSQLPKAPPQE